MISVAVCTWRRPLLLKRALDSICAQSLKDFPILVIDNNSRDDTERVVKNYPYPHVRYILETNQGVAFARNRALVECTTPYLAFLDDDEVADAGWLMALQQGLKEGAAITGGKITLEWQGGERPRWLVDSLLSGLGALDYGYSQFLEHPKMLFVGNMALDVAKVKKLGGFATRLGFSAGGLLGNEEILLQQQLRQSQERLYYAHDAVISNLVDTPKITKRFFMRRFYGQGQADAVMKRLTDNPPLYKRLWFKAGALVYILKLYKWVLVLPQAGGLFLQTLRVAKKIGFFIKI
jgi:glucosyl-dolichyl phosphate glucuronosyltransferase